MSILDKAAGMFRSEDTSHLLKVQTVWLHRIDDPMLRLASACILVTVGVYLYLVPTVITVRIKPSTNL